jgi:Na+-translocating ferredoxin:NAD+ oxidoreductase subunit B
LSRKAFPFFNGSRSQQADRQYNASMDPSRRKTDTLAERIDALLPQTQCRQCGYSGCRPYADAIAAGATGINRCPPGGDETIRELAALTGLPAGPLDPACGEATPSAVAVIDETTCIGCTLCIQACPVDAIVGAAKLMHTVIAAECSGCRLCVPPCPVDCISMPEAGAGQTAIERRQRAVGYRTRFVARKLRLEREQAQRSAAPRESAAERRKRETVARALQRARQRLAQRAKR